MTGSRESIVDAARRAARQAHAPYSGIHVGAALVAASGAVYRGNNVENAAYPLGNCAETSAIAVGVQAEGVAFRIAEIAVWATDRDGAVIAASPCGGCRQRIRELASGDSTAIHFPWQAGEIRTVTIAELLPFAFSLPSSQPSR